MLKRLALLALLASICPHEACGQKEPQRESVPPKTLSAPESTNASQKQNAPRQESPESHAGIEWSNWALVVIAAITAWAVWKQANESAKATRAIKDQISVAQNEFIATQRPKIAVRTFYFHEPHSITGQMPNGILEGSFLMGQFYVVNLGGTRAIIKKILYEFYTTRESKLPAKRPWEGKDGKPWEGKLEPGQSQPCLFSRLEPVSPDEAFPLFSKKLHLYLMGWIDYVDDLNIRRTTRFCRLYDPDTNRFTPVEDTEYESAD